MSTYRSTFNKRKGTELTGWAARCVLGRLIALLFIPFILSSSPIASAAQKIGSNSPEDIARAGVSIVRLVVSYGPSAPAGHTLSSASSAQNNSKTSLTPSSVPIPAPCTGLGVLVASWSSSSKEEQNAWVLTDGSLVNRDGFTCATPSLPNVNLLSVKVLLSNAYSTLQQQGYSGKVDTVQCSQRPCSNGVSLFSFHSDIPLPFINIFSNLSNTPSYTAIALSTSSSSLTTPVTSANNFPQYLTPSRVALNGEATPTVDNLSGRERGTPLVSRNGALLGIYVATNSQPKLAFIDEISNLLNEQNIAENTSTHQNPVHDNWNSGISEYVQGTSHYSKARDYFNRAFSASNQQFQGAQTFARIATQQSDSGDRGSSSSASTPSADKNGITLPSLGFVPYLVLIVSILGLVLLIVLLVFLSALFRRGQRLREEFAEADREAALQAQKIQEMEVAQRQQPQQAPPPQPPPPVWAQPTIPQGMSPVTSQAAQQPLNGVPIAPLASMSAGSTQSGFPMQSSAIADAPTVDMIQETQRNRQMETDNTIPFSQSSLRPIHGEQLGFEIITSTDPGLKRKHKPNEDSLFAIQGVRNGNGSLQQIGLFVVADGMGGHANGQDASRLAIQTIIDYVLPRLVHNGAASEPAQLLVDSVQGANQAVHQHNADNHADMGTTVTATLVIDSTAYIANVGDSRTYLYRVSEGLSKVTRDHSVVASLVDAGIIKPDDIYTHPKRNQIYRSLGEKPFVEVDPFVVQLQSGDKLLLCSDGLWDMVRDPKIEEVLKTPTADPRQVGDNLIKAALEGGGEDNVSVIVVNVIEMAQRDLKPGLEPIYVQQNIHLPQLS